MTDHLSIPTPAGTFDAIAAGPEDGRPVLLLHGFPEAAIAWEDVLYRLEREGIRAVAPDQRGYSPGVRPENAVDYGIDDLVGDVIAIADELGWGRFDLVGHDWGAAVGWHTADQHPDRLRTLTAVSTPHPAALAEAHKTDEDQHMRSQYMTEWRQARTTERRMSANNFEAIRQMFDYRVTPGRIAEYILRLSEPGALTAALNWYRAGKPHGRIGKIDVPTLYVWSTEDVAFGSVAALDTENWVSAAYRFEMFEDVTHWVLEEVPDALTAVLLEHLAAH
ncbi:alpha/beta fold hydrolase [Amycolatopsis sp. NPDC059657]|uniref:alpha/beta fold hydrolase n=1 Tax=Amycolatopsis sp. NPDC059657 TaxID=3346899 RepID=UPI0036732961